MKKTQKAGAMIEAILQQAGNPSDFRQGIASQADVPLAEVDELIAAAGSPRDVSEETIARERMAADAGRRHTEAYREWDHEED